jgi:hypothetical protein
MMTDEEAREEAICWLEPNIESHLFRLSMGYAWKRVWAEAEVLDAIEMVEHEKALEYLPDLRRLLAYVRERGE